MRVSVRTRWIQRATSAAVFLAACREPNVEPVGPPCIPFSDDPDSNDELTPSLDVEPEVLWVTPLGTIGLEPAVVASDDVVVVSAGWQLWTLDNSGQVVRTDPGGGRPTIGPDGTIHTDGILSPSGVLVVSTPGGWLEALDAQSRDVLWATRVNDEGDAPSLVAGFGDVLFIHRHASVDAPRVYDARDGTPLSFPLEDPSDPMSYAGAGRALGVVGVAYSDHTPLPRESIHVLDFCGIEKWRLPRDRPRWFALIGPHDRLITGQSDDDGETLEVLVHDETGALVAGPAIAPPPVAVGADGTIYGVDCDPDDDTAEARVVALDQALERLWEVPIGAGCTGPGAALSSSGVLYLARQNDENGVEVLAVQTPSAGEAKSSWPIRWGRDSRGTRWVTW